MKSSRTGKPKILLIGAGRFGEQHLKALLALEKEGRILFAGVVERNPERRVTIAATYHVPIFDALTPRLLRGVDAVDVVTQPSTHYALVSKLIRKTNVFVEKPVTLIPREALRLAALAGKSNHILAVGHIYRHNGAVTKLRELARESATTPFHIEGLFTDAPAKFPDDCGILFSDLHAFDIFDFLLGKDPRTVTAHIATRTSGYNHEDNAVAVLGYPDNITAAAVLSWTGLPKTRVITISFSDKRIVADLLTQVIEIIYPDRREKIECFRAMPLQAELGSFISALEGGGNNYTDGVTAARIVNIVAHLYRSAARQKTIVYMPL